MTCLHTYSCLAFVTTGWREYANNDDTKHCLVTLDRKWTYLIFLSYSIKGQFVRNVKFYLDENHNTVDSRYLEFQGTLEHFEISVPRNIRVAEVRKAINRTTPFNEWIRNLTPEVRDIENIVEKRRNCSWGAISTLFHIILLPLLRFPS